MVQQQPIGTIIRQLRRQQNQTQTELGGTIYSKSYVSAIECGKLLPSREALRHFAQSLEQSEQYFLTLLDEQEAATYDTPTNLVADLEPEALKAIVYEMHLFLDLANYCHVIG